MGRTVAQAESNGLELAHREIRSAHSSQNRVLTTMISTPVTDEQASRSQGRK